MDDARAAKRRLRSEMAAQRKALSRERRAAAARAVARLVLAMPEYERSSCVAAYVATSDEISIAEVLEAVLTSGRTLLLPRVTGDALGFVATTELGALRVGSHGVQEPIGSLAAAPAGTDLVLVPGLAFDANGGRLGRGAGHYDRSLAIEGTSVFGVGFAFQLVERVPMERHDRRLDGVVTEDGIVRVAHDPTGLSS